MNENLDLAEILKGCPKGTKLYSSIFGDVMFERISNDSLIYVTITDWEDYECSKSFRRDGSYDIRYSGECTLFPSKDQRDWSKFIIPIEPKEDLQKGTLVLCKDEYTKWRIRVYAEKGQVVESGFLQNEHRPPVVFDYILRCPLTVPTKEYLEDIEITDENNYGKFYWNKFKEE